MVVSTRCVHCAAVFTYDRSGPGRMRRYCGSDCRLQSNAEKAKRKLAALSDDQRRSKYDYKRALRCARCDKRMYQSDTSLPQGEATCRDCRRKLMRDWRAQLAADKFAAKPALVRRRKKWTKKPVRPGYGYAHKEMRRALLEKFVELTPCPLCAEPMTKDQALDLDHSNPDDLAAGLPGDRLTHATCNRREGAIRRNGGTATRLPCEICGTPVPRAGQPTCGRPCGAEYRKQNAERGAQWSQRVA